MGFKQKALAFLGIAASLSADNTKRGAQTQSDVAAIVAERVKPLPKNRHSNRLKKHRRVKKKGTIDYYFFRDKGEYYALEDPKGEAFFTCTALNATNAIRKYRSYIRGNS